MRGHWRNPPLRRPSDRLFRSVCKGFFPANSLLLKLPYFRRRADPTALTPFAPLLRSGVSLSPAGSRPRAVGLETPQHGAAAPAATPRVVRKGRGGYPDPLVHPALEFGQGLAFLPPPVIPVIVGLAYISRASSPVVISVRGDQRAADARPAIGRRSLAISSRCATNGRVVREQHRVASA